MAGVTRFHPEGALDGKKDELNNGRNLAEEIAYNQMMIELCDVRRWVDNEKLKQSLIPADWHEVETDVPVRRRKTKITADFDTDMVKWFRAMGLGYQARMNQVLRTWMLAVIAKEIERQGDRDWKGDRLRRR
jgi:uncharacterized protein (DUF4415 family)